MKAIVSILVVIFIVALAFFGLVRVVNKPEHYKTEIETAMSTALGQTVTINSPIEIKWTPFPVIRLKDVTVSGSNKKNPVMLKADLITLKPNLRKLIQKKIFITDIVIEKGQLYLERISETEANWLFPLFQKKLNIAEQQAHVLGNLQTVSLKNMEIFYSSYAHNTETKVNNVTANVKMKSLTGPFEITATAKLKEEQFALKSTINQIVFNEQTNYKVLITAKRSNLSLEGQGNFFAGPAKGSDFAFTVTFSVSDPGFFLETTGISFWGSSMIKVPTVGNFSVEKKGSSLEIPSFTLKVGSTDDAFAVSGNFSDKNGLSNLDLGINSAKVSDISEIEKITALIFEQNNKLKLQGNFSILLPTLTVKETKMQNVHIKGIINQENIEITSAEALLSENSKLVFVGKILPSNEFVLAVRVETEKAQKLLSFFPALPAWITEPEKLYFQGKISKTKDVLGFLIEEMRLDEIKLSGNVFLNKNNAIQKNIQLTIDNFKFPKTLTDRETPNMPLSQIPENILNWATTYFKPNISLDLRFNNAQMDTIDFSKLRFFVVTDNTDITVNDISVFANDLKAEISGKIIPADKKYASFMMNWEIKNLDSWLKLLPIQQNQLLEKEKTLSIKTKMTGNLENLETVGSFATDDLFFSVNGIIDINDKFLIKSGSYEIHYPSFQKAIRLFIPEYNLLPDLDGKFVSQGELEQRQNAISLKNTKNSIGTNLFSGDIGFSKGKNFNNLTAQLIAQNLDATIFAFPKNKGDFDFSILDSWEFNVELTAQQLKLDKFIFDNVQLNFLKQNNNLTIKQKAKKKYELSGEAFIKLDTPPSFHEKLDIKKYPVPTDLWKTKNISLSGGFLDGLLDISFTGKNEDEQKKSMSGKGKISVVDTVVQGLDFSSFANFLESSLKNKTNLSRFKSLAQKELIQGETLFNIAGDFEIKNGTVSGSNFVLSTQGLESKNTEISFQSIRDFLNLKTNFQLRKYPQVPAVQLDLNGVLYNPKMVENYAQFYDYLQNENIPLSPVADKKELIAISTSEKTDVDNLISETKQVMDKLQQDFENKNAYPDLTPTFQQLRENLNQITAESTAANQEKMQNLLSQTKVVFQRTKQLESELLRQKQKKALETVSSFYQKATEIQNSAEKVPQSKETKIYKQEISSLYTKITTVFEQIEEADSDKQFSEIISNAQETLKRMEELLLVIFQKTPKKKVSGSISRKKTID